MADTKPQIQEAQRTPSMINTQKNVPKHIIFKLQKIKDKEKILKEVRSKNRGIKLKITSDFFSETVQARL